MVQAPSARPSRRLVRGKVVGEDGVPGHGLDDFVHERRGRERRVAEFERVGRGGAPVGLEGCVGGGAGVDFPGPDTEGGEGGEGGAVVGRYLGWGFSR